MKKLVTTLCALLLFGCAGKGEKTNAELKLFSGQLAITSYTGGVMLWGSSTDGENAFGQLLTDNTFSIELSNGTWNFVAIGWDGGTTMGGTPSCAVATAVELGGTDVVIDLTLDNAKCDHALVSGGVTAGSADYTFPRNSIYVCNSDAPLDGNGCGGTLKGYASSVQPYFPSYVKIDGAMINVDVANGLTEACHSIDGASDSGQALTAFNIPTGGPGSPLYTIMRAYMGDGDCEAATDGPLSPPVDMIFPSGLTGGVGVPAYISAYTNNPSPSSHEEATLEIAMNKATLCTPERIAATPFAAGEGDIGRPYVICSIDQLDGIGGDTNWSTYSGSSFILGRNIDYFLENGVDLIDVQQNGTSPDYDDSIALGPDLTSTATPYTGSFDGRGYKVIGFQLKDLNNINSVVTSVGFIKDMGTAGTLKNITFLMPTIEGKSEDQTNTHSNIGVAVGSNAGTISNVKVILGELKGFDSVGGIVGRNDGIIDTVDARMMRIEGFQKIGGIAGSFGNTSGKYIARAVFEGRLKPRGRGYCSNSTYNDESSCTTNSGIWTDNYYFGGIVGMLDTCNGPDNEISESAAHGEMSAYDYAGGLVGKVLASSGCTINDSITDMTIQTKSSANSAGLVGYHNGSNLTANRLVRASGAAYYNQGPLFQDFTTAGVTGTTVYTVDPARIASGYADSYYRVQSNYSALDFTNIWAMDQDGYDYPRLQIEEQRPCTGRMANAPFAGGNGSEAAPFEICTLAQLDQVKNYATGGNHFLMLRDIGLRDHTPGSTTYLDIATFDGNFDGGGKSIYEINFTTHSGLFGTLAIGSRVKNLDLISYQSGVSGSTGGLLAATNNAAVIKVNGHGLINNNGSNPVTCLIGTNNGALLGSRGDCTINVNTALSEAIGGLAAVNTGAMLYNEFNGEINLSTLNEKIGGIAGRSGTGVATGYFDTIRNTTINFGGANGVRFEENTFDGNIKLNAGGYQSSKIGGLVGTMEGVTTVALNNQLRGQIIYNASTLSDYFDYTGSFASAPANTAVGKIYQETSSSDIYLDDGVSWNLIYNIGTNPFPSAKIGYTPKGFYTGGVTGTCDSSAEISNNYINTRFEFKTTFPAVLNNTWSAICGTGTPGTITGNFYVYGPQPVNFNSDNSGGILGAYSSSGNTLNTLTSIDTLDATSSTASTIYVQSGTTEFLGLLTTEEIHVGTGIYTISDNSNVASNYVTVVEAVASLPDDGSPVYLMEPISSETDANTIFAGTLGWTLGTDYDDLTAPWMVESDGRPYLLRQDRAGDDFDVDKYVDVYLNNR